MLSESLRPPAPFCRKSAAGPALGSPRGGRPEADRGACPHLRPSQRSLLAVFPPFRRNHNTVANLRRPISPFRLRKKPQHISLFPASKKAHGPCTETASPCLLFSTLRLHPAQLGIGAGQRARFAGHPLAGEARKASRRSWGRPAGVVALIAQRLSPRPERYLAVSREPGPWTPLDAHDCRRRHNRRTDCCRSPRHALFSVARQESGRHQRCI